MGDIPPTTENKQRVFRPLYVSQTPSKPDRKCKCSFKWPWLKRQWYKRTLPERIFFIVTLIAIVVIIALSITIHVLKKNSVIPVNVCLSKECVTTAGRILNSLDATKDPCQNFYNFACGGFMDKSLVPDEATLQDNYDAPAVNIFTQQLSIFHARVRALMEEPLNETYPKSMLKARDLYKSCVNFDKIEELGSHPLDDFLKTIGGWPVVAGADWNEQLFNWKDALYQLYTHGFVSSLFFDISVVKDSQNPQSNILSLEKPHLKIPIDEENYVVDSWEDDPKTLKYYYFMVNASVLFGANRTRAEEEMKKTIEFEDKMADILVHSRQEKPLRVPIANLQELLPQINWIECFHKILPFKVAENETISVEEPTALGKILDLIGQTPKRVVADYMIWRTVQHSLPHLSLKNHLLAMEFSQPHLQHYFDMPRWYTCLQSVWTSVVTPAAVYVQKYLQPKDKEMVEEIVNVIRDELKPIINKLHGLKPQQRQDALDLIETMQHYIFPEEFLRDEDVDEFYSSLSFNEDEYFHNILKLFKFLNDVTLKELLRPSNQPHWANVHFPFHVGLKLGYNYENTIEIPFYMLVGINFDGNRPRYINYAALAAHLGTEILNLLPEQVRNKMFPDRDRCNIVQLKNHQISSVLSDSMEISASLKLAYSAYKKWVNKHCEEKPLPGLKYTPYQLYWITDATMHCAKYEKDSSQQPFVISRINIPPSNLNEFAQDFQCPVGSPMNQEEKCEII